MADPHDKIPYEALQQEALRGVVRAALKHLAAMSVPSGHNFMIAFKTAAPGVTLPKPLLAQYPDEMRIQLEHQYWDLAPGETFFSVTLRFGGQPMTLSIPYAAITHFSDENASYQLRFTPLRTGPVAVPAPVPIPAPVIAAATAAESVEKPTSDKPGDGPNIVSLDHFRKK